MRRLTTVLVVLTLALPAANAYAAVSRRQVPDRAQVRVLKVVKVIGPAVDAQQWGPLKVIVLIRRVKENGKLVSQRITKVVVPTYPSSNFRSEQINEEALPILTNNALVLQSATVDDLSGATLTCEAFRQSLAAALKRAQFLKI